MAEIIVQGDRCNVHLGTPDDDGDYLWTAECGARGDAYRPLDEAVMDADVHADIRCERPEE